VSSHRKRLGSAIEAWRARPRPSDQPERERLASLGASSTKPLRLHVGCGPRVLAGWVNIDLAYEPFENYLQYYGDEFYPPGVRGGREDFFAIDITKGIPLPDNSVDVVFNEDFIEHLNQRDAVAFLAEVLRVLVDGGVHRINTPDLIESMRKHSNFARGHGGVYFTEWDQHTHLNIMTPSYLEELARLVGYSRFELSSRDQSCADGMPPEYRPDPADRPESGNIFADLIR